MTHKNILTETFEFTKTLTKGTLLLTTGTVGVLAFANDYVKETETGKAINDLSFKDCFVKESVVNVATTFYDEILDGFDWDNLDKDQNKTDDKTNETNTSNNGFTSNI